MFVTMETSQQFQFQFGFVANFTVLRIEDVTLSIVVVSVIPMCFLSSTMYSVVNI